MADSDAPGEATETGRQRLLDLLDLRSWTFDELVAHLDTTPRALEDDLRHTERTIKHQQRRLVVDEPTCRACGFEFKGRSKKHFHPPGRCPKCRSGQIHGPVLRLR